MLIRSLIHISFIVLSAAVWADGQYEINQLCVANGCFAGDNPGWPVEITKSGSYRLTSNLEVPPDFLGIDMDGDSVTLDLNGFSVHSDAVCGGPLPTCTPSTPGTGTGILVNSQETIIRNGVIRGFNEDCIRGFPRSALLKDLNISNCVRDGISLNNSGILKDVSVDSVGRIGASVTNLYQVIDSTFIGAGSWGVLGSICRGNVFFSNGDETSVSEEACWVTDSSNYCDGVPCP